MNPDTSTNTAPLEAEAEPPPQAWIGLDWGQHTHAFALQERGTTSREEGTLPHSAESIHSWLRQLQERFGSRPVALAIEGGREALIAAMLPYPWLKIYPVNPATSARYRNAFTPSRASDDVPDARVPLELVRDHADKLRPFQSQDPATVELDGLVQVRRDLVNRRTQVLNQITSLLRDYYPQAIELVGDLNSDLALDFLDRWPDLISLKAAKPSTIKRFYHAHNLRRPELLDQRLAFIGQATALITDPARINVATLHLRALLDQARALRKHVAILDEASKIAFAKHPEADLFRNLPGAGPVMAPRLCVAFGTIRTLYPDPTSLQQHSGLAPVREKSGQQLWTHWRWQAPTFLRQTFVEWAGQTVVYSPWAKVYYNRMLAKGKSHHVILRALAFKWIRILWKCWQTHTPYDETRFLKQLINRKSPNAISA